MFRSFIDKITEKLLFLKFNENKNNQKNEEIENSIEYKNSENFFNKDEIEYISDIQRFENEGGNCC